MVKDRKSTDSVLDWLLEPGDPGVRYLALRDLVKAGCKELAEAKKAAHTHGPIAEVLSKMDKEGFWVKPGAGYFPLYTGTVWSVILLAQLGADIKMDKRIAAACAYILDHNMTEYGHFSTSGVPSANLDCLQGNLCYSLFDLGCTDPRLDKAYELMARYVTGEGIAPATDKKEKIRYFSARPGPAFACSGTLGKSCAWGAIPVMLALSRLPAGKRTSLMQKAIKTGIDFLFSRDPAAADYPLGAGAKPTSKPSGNWWKFGFPYFYAADVLQNAEVLVLFGYGKDPRLSNALQLIRDKQDSQGRWQMEHSYTGKTWVDFGPNHQPNKWVTLRALRVLNMVEG